MGYYGEPRADVAALIAAAGRDVLDVGCGEGALALGLKRAGARWVVGIELDASAAAVAREGIDLVLEGDAATVPLDFPEASFDYLIFADTLEHMPEPERVLARMLPLLRPEGRVIVSVPNIRFYLVLGRLVFDRWAYTDAGVRDRTHLRIFTRRSLERMLAGHGLAIERLERNYRLFEDQSEIGRLGSFATRVVKAVAPLLFPDLMAYQYIAVARRTGDIVPPDQAP